MRKDSPELKSEYQLTSTPTLSPHFQLENAAPRPHRFSLLLGKRVRSWIQSLLAEYRYAEADQLFAQSWFCYTRAHYAALRHRYWTQHRESVLAHLTELFERFAFAEADALASRSIIVIEPQEYATLKMPHVLRYFRARGHQMNEEQATALVSPARHLLVKARAGSGKTSTIAAKAALLIEHEQIAPDQILMLAFNKEAAEELQDRIQKKFGFANFRTASTFHSLAFRLVLPNERLSSEDEERLELVEKTMQILWTPWFRLLVDRFFKATDDPIIEAEAQLDNAAHLIHRWATVKHLSISGHQVRSKGEKWIADFLFAHDIRFEYERVFTDNRRNYRPDFTITERVAPYNILAILEHWGVSEATPDDATPFGDGMRARDYRNQMAFKRNYWREKGVPLIETSVDDMRQGRTAFEQLLLAKLTQHNIEATRLSDDVLAERVQRRYWNGLTQLMAQFIQRAKNRRLTPAQVKEISLNLRQSGLRTRIFWRLAARVYAAYEPLLAKNAHMDFQDLLARAAEKLDAHKGKLQFHPKGAISQAPEKPVELAEVRWLLIDEYQDFNPGFHHLIQTMRRHNPNLRLFCVGDDWQAINSFAGSEPTFFRDFTTHFDPHRRGEAATVLLRTNYRSARAIVQIGNLLMQQFGEASLAARTDEGKVHLTEIDRLWLPTLTTSLLSQEDAVQSNGNEDNRNTDKENNHEQGKNKNKRKFDNGFMAAKCLEICKRLSLPMLKNQKSVTILSRTHWIHGLEDKEFRTELIRQMGSHWRKSYEGKLQVNTIHAYKGKEADLVILADVTDGQMPMIHQNTQLYAPLLPPNVNPLEEARIDERRLFYVALTRAKETLWILTEGRLPSEFVTELALKPTYPTTIPPIAD